MNRTAGVPGVASAAVAAQNARIIEILSSSESGDDNDDNVPLLAMTRRRKRARGVMVDRRKRSPQRTTTATTPGAAKSVIDLSSMGSGDSPPPTAAAAAASQPARHFDSKTSEVLDVFPDADVQDVQTILRRNFQNVQAAVHHMADKGYKKVKVPKQQQQQANRQRGVSVSGGLKWSYDFMASDSFTPTADYIVQAKEKLISEFPFLTKTGVNHILQKSDNKYARAHDAIVTALKGTGDDETKYRRLHGALQTSPCLEQVIELNSMHPRRKDMVLKNPRKRKNPSNPHITDHILLEEITYVQGKLSEFLENGRKHESMEQKKAAAVKSNTAIECSCCFDGYDIDDMVACSREGHLFCVDCLRHCVETQVFGNGSLGVNKETKKPALEITCFHGDGCSSGFDRSTLEKALPRRTLEKYDELQFKSSLDAAGLDCLVTCPQCDFQAELPFGQKVFVCPVATCKFESCRECGEAAHIPLR